MYYFTSDEHYGHNNIIKYCDRPFNNIQEMNKELIERSNSIVNENDILIHAGDFTLGNKEEAYGYISKLKGRHIFLRGSHDYWNKGLSYIWEGKIEGIYVDEPVLINKIDKAFASVMPKQEKFCTQCDNELISPQEMKQGICDNCKFYLNKGNLK